MAPNGFGMGLVLVLVTMLWARTKAQSTCTSALLSMAPCLNYVTGSSSTPSSSCCSQLASIVQSQPQCLCSVLGDGGAALGISINKTLALALPGACNVQTPPVSRCNGVGGTATSPSDSPLGSPEGLPSGDSWNETMSGTSVSGAGSKTVPSTGGSSEGLIVKLPLQLILFFLFIISCASNFSSY